MVEVLLGFWRLAAGPLARLGVDREAFLAILEVKLLQDQRRTTIGLPRRGKPSNMLLVGVGTYALVGLFVGLMLLRIGSPLVGATIVHAFVMTMMGLTLVGDFTHVLVDTADSTILLPRPVDDRTLLAARTAHIVSYLGLMALALSAGSLVVGSFAYHPLFAPLLLVTLALSLFLVISVVYAFYLMLLRRADLERFRDVVLYFQIGMTVFFFGAYQLLPRLMSQSALSDLRIDDRTWIYFCPPAWMGGPFDLLTGRIGTPQAILTLLAVVVPLLALLLVVRVLAPGFSRALAALGSSAAAAERRRRRPVRTSRLSRLWGRLLARDREERAGFGLVWALASRDRAFKLSSYPAMALVLVLGGVLVLGLGDPMGRLAKGWSFLILLYVTCYLAPVAVLQIRISDTPAAAWIALALPLERPGVLLTAAIEVVLARMALPIFALVALPVVLVRGPAVLLDVAIAGGVLVGSALLVTRIVEPALPFSQPRSAESSGQTAGMFLYMLVALGAGLVHGLALLPHPWLKLPALALLVAGCALGIRRLRRLPGWAFAEIGEG